MKIPDGPEKHLHELLHLRIGQLLWQAAFAGGRQRLREGGFGMSRMKKRLFTADCPMSFTE